jgi:hypothetical protein
LLGTLLSSTIPSGPIRDHWGRLVPSIYPRVAVHILWCDTFNLLRTIDCYDCLRTVRLTTWSKYLITISLLWACEYGDWFEMDAVGAKLMILKNTVDAQENVMYLDLFYWPSSLPHFYILLSGLSPYASWWRPLSL